MRAALFVLALAACENHGKPELKRDVDRQSRVIDPPSDRVRPLPPHAIRADGVGPYRLRASLAELLDQIPEQSAMARNYTLDLPGLVHWSLLRTEDDAILIGGEPLGKASFITVISPDVARTESGVHVGSTREELVKALGPLAADPDRARDPHVVVPASLRNARVVLDSDRITAFVITSDTEQAPPPADATCERPKLESEAGSGASGSGKLRDRVRLTACLATGEVIAIEDDDITVRTLAADRAVSVHVPGLVFAAPLRTPGEDHDELVAVSRVDDAQQRTWSLSAFRMDGGKLVRSFGPEPLYQLTADTARWIGAELRDVDLYLEVVARPGRIEVGGLLTTRTGDKLRYAVAISPQSRPRRAKSAPPEAAGAGNTERAVEPSDASAVDAQPHR
jgi:hypothetical protein